MDEYVRSEVFEERMKRVDDENSRQNHRLGKLEEVFDRLTDMTTSVRELAINMNAMKEELQRQGKRLDEIEKEPAEKWRKLVWIIITAIAGAVVGFIVSKIGM